MSIKIYGVPLSQPVRAVLWPCVIKRVAFSFEAAVPGMGGRIGTKGPDFRAKFPLGTVPALEDKDVHLSESVAILSYLSDKFSWHDIYPTDVLERARVHEYMSWSHRNTREASTRVFGPHVRPDARPAGTSWRDEGLKSVEATCKLIDSYWLQRTPFLAGHAPTIADFSAYEELAQLGPRFGKLVDFSSHPNLSRWIEQMASLPHHDAMHASLTELGPLDPLLALDAKQLGAKLGAATKAGTAAITAAVKAAEKATPAPA
ncbi:hypothetical protein KFE25_005144 [Diacronema lutheri]|nr:hypothetical protein KFE25_005144 [Diacronema lutheri]